VLSLLLRPTSILEAYIPVMYAATTAAIIVALSLFLYVPRSPVSCDVRPCVRAVHATGLTPRLVWTTYSRRSATVIHRVGPISTCGRRLADRQLISSGCLVSVGGPSCPNTHDASTQGRSSLLKSGVSKFIAEDRIFINVNNPIKHLTDTSCRT